MLFRNIAILRFNWNVCGYIRMRTGHIKPGACPGGGAQGAWPPPPLEIEKQKKKKVIRANIKLFHLYFATFLVENIIFSAIF